MAKDGAWKTRVEWNAVLAGANTEVVARPQATRERKRISDGQESVVPRRKGYYDESRKSDLGQKMRAGINSRRTVRYRTGTVRTVAKG